MDSRGNMASRVITLAAFCCGAAWVSAAPSRSAQTSTSSVSSAPGRCTATVTGTAIDLWDYLPSNWTTICKVVCDADPEVDASISCHVKSNEPVIWKLTDLRLALANLVNQSGLEIAVDLHCETGGIISLPYPMRAPGLVKLTVSNCFMLDQYADFNTSAEKLGDWMRVQNLRDCVWLISQEDRARVLDNTESISSDYDCGQDSTLRIYIYRNISTTFQADGCSSQIGNLNLTQEDLEGLLTGSSEFLDNFINTTVSRGFLSEECADQFKSFLQISRYSTYPSTENPRLQPQKSREKLNQIKTKCLFQNLQVYDESQSPFLEKKTFQYLTDNSEFPALTTLKYSSSGITEVPKELREWRVYFGKSKHLQLIDLSNNNISQVDSIPPYLNLSETVTTLNLQFNKLSMIPVRKFEEWVLVPNFLIDIRNNPVDCSCDLKELLTQLQKDSRWAVAPRVHYKQQLAEMKCATPKMLSGRVISSLFVEDLQCPVVTRTVEKGPELIIGVLVAVVVCLLVLLLLTVRYRKEIRILLYTRVAVIVPCGSARLAPRKQYDAFVAYAHQDSDWVLNTLVKKLEESNRSWHSGPCKLCIHQRDFVVGKSIIDNIIDSVAASRHSIIVLTKNFAKSSWAMEELQQAYRQSLEERRRHLVVVVLEDVPEADMAPVLRRCCKTFTYLHVKDSLFWDRLQYSILLSDKGMNGGRYSSNANPDENDNDAFITEENSEERTTRSHLQRTLFTDRMQAIHMNSTSSSASPAVIISSESILVIQ